VRVIELGQHMAHAKLAQRFLSNWNIKKTRLSKILISRHRKTHHHGHVPPLFLFSESSHLRVFAADELV
jgi:hypothetical protein